MIDSLANPVYGNWRRGLNGIGVTLPEHTFVPHGNQLKLNWTGMESLGVVGDRAELCDLNCQLAVLLRKD